QRHRLSYSSLPVVHQVAKLSNGHFCTNVLTHGNQSQTESSIRLEEIFAFLLWIDALRAQVKHALEFQNVTSTGICTSVDEHAGRTGNGLLNRLESLQCSIRIFL